MRYVSRPGPNEISRARSPMRIRSRGAERARPFIAQALANLLDVADVAVISGGDWPQFDKQVASNLPARADLKRLWMMPTTGTKLFVHKGGAWSPVYAELFADDPDPVTRAELQDLLDAARTGTVLVEKVGRSVRLTEAGAVLARHATPVRNR